MPFPSSQDADNRLVANEASLSQQEVRDLIPWMRLLSEAGMRRLRTELDLMQISAIQRFEESSRRLARGMAAMTAILVILTAVLVYLTRELLSISR